MSMARTLDKLSRVGVMLYLNTIKKGLTIVSVAPMVVVLLPGR